MSTRAAGGGEHLGRAFSGIIASDPQEAEALFEPARDKVYRHPSFYAIPDEVKNL